MDKQDLLKGVTFKQPEQATCAPPLQPQMKPKVLPSGTGEHHNFNLPVDTAGSAKLKRHHTTEPEIHEASHSQSHSYVVFEGKAFPIVFNPYVLFS
jgi:hypothetical protein